jgi:HD-like signal output (HDOD) protein
VNKPRILFVDDEPLMLQGLRNLLWKDKSRWDLVFADGGLAALALLDSSPCDLIVSDMQMPGMDGTELLTEVSNRHPATVRLILSGYADRASMLRGVPMAHQYLGKPCNSTTLRGAIERALGLRSVLENETLRRMVGKITNLPSVAPTFHELCRAVSNAKCGINEITGIVQSDPAMAVRVLQLANSAFFGATSEVTSIQQAVRSLGTTMLKGLALVGNILSALEAKPTDEFSTDQWQGNWIRSARLAKSFMTDTARAETAFTAALVRDIGKVIMASEMPGPFSEILREMKASGRTQHAVESERLGVTHAEIGAYLLGVWGLPFSIIQSVAFHHMPRMPADDTADIVAAVHVAGTLTDARDMIHPPAELASLLDAEFLKASGADRDLPRWLALAGQQDAEIKRP